MRGVPCRPCYHARMSEGYRTFEHTGDLGLEVWAESPERLYALAALAVQAQTVEAQGGPREIERRLSLEGEDPPDLLVHWLNTVVLEADVQQAVWIEVEVHAFTARSLEATLAGPRRDRAHQVFLREIKAVSHHALELDLAPGRCRCRLILDL